MKKVSIILAIAIILTSVLSLNVFAVKVKTPGMTFTELDRLLRANGQ